MAGDDDTQHIHKRISDLSRAFIYMGIVLILLACAVGCMSLDDAINGLSRVF